MRKQGAKENKAGPCGQGTVAGDVLVQNQVDEAHEWVATCRAPDTRFESVDKIASCEREGVSLCARQTPDAACDSE